MKARVFAALVLASFLTATSVFQSDVMASLSNNQSSAVNRYNRPLRGISVDSSDINLLRATVSSSADPVSGSNDQQSSTDQTNSNPSSEQSSSTNVIQSGNTNIDSIQSGNSGAGSDVSGSSANSTGEALSTDQSKKESVNQALDSSNLSQTPNLQNFIEVKEPKSKSAIPNYLMAIE